MDVPWELFWLWKGAAGFGAVAEREVPAGAVFHFVAELRIGAGDEADLQRMVTSPAVAFRNGMSLLGAALFPAAEFGMAAAPVRAADLGMGLA